MKKTKKDVQDVSSTVEVTPNWGDVAVTKEGKHIEIEHGEGKAPKAPKKFYNPETNTVEEI